MMNRRRIEALENRLYKPGSCRTCGASETAPSIGEVLYCEGDEPPLGYYYEKPWTDFRPGERFPYPPDPRPVCPTCGCINGPTLFLTAVYDKNEWDALRKKVDAEQVADSEQ